MLDYFTISGTSPAAPGTAVIGLPILGMERFTNAKIVASLVGATGGVLDIYIQWTPDNSTWYDYAHFTQLSAGASAIKYSCDTKFGATGITTIGTNTTPILAAGTVVGGEFGIGFRCLAVAGSSTSAGAAVTVLIGGDRKSI